MLCLQFVDGLISDLLRWRPELAQLLGELEEQVFLTGRQDKVGRRLRGLQEQPMPAQLLCMGASCDLGTSSGGGCTVQLTGTASTVSSPDR